MNMNIMSWVYDQLTDSLGNTGHYTLGAALMIGKLAVSRKSIAG